MKDMNFASLKAFARWRIAAVIVAVGLLGVGLATTSSVVGSTRALRITAMYAQHLQMSTTAARYFVSVYISPVGAAISARQVIKGRLSGFVSRPGIPPILGPTQALTDAIAANFPHRNMTIGAVGVIRQSERQSYEAWLSDECASVLNASSLGITALSLVPGPRRSAPISPDSSSGFYPLRLATTVSGSNSKEVSCEQAGMDFTPFANLIRVAYLALDSGRIIWVPPARQLTANAGANDVIDVITYLVLPLMAATVTEAGAVGETHHAYMLSNPSVIAPCPVPNVTSASDPSVCGHSRRSLGAVFIPMDTDSPLDALADSLPAICGSKITLLYVPPTLNRLLNVDLDGTPHDFTALFAQNATPVPDTQYLEENFLSKVTGQLKFGTLRPLLSALTPSRVLFSAVYDSGSARWVKQSAAQALVEAAQGDEDKAQLQAAKVFVLGASAYVIVVRDLAGVDTPEYFTWTWAVGGLLSTLLAILIPGAMYYLAWRQQRHMEVEMALLQSEKDGVVQAVAFAAHEIRNPMHGVLASIETALADLQPLQHLLQSIRQGTGAGEEDEGILRSILGRLLGPSACDTALAAMEDIEVAKGAAENCHRLVNDMVNYSKLQRGAMSIQNSDMNVRAALPALLDSQRSFLHPSVRTFVTIDEQVPAAIFTDQVRVLQVLTNGLTNASKFTHSGAIYLSCRVVDTSDTPSLRLPSNPSNKFVAFLVADTGKGLAGIDVDTLFEPFKEHAGNSVKPQHKLSAAAILHRARAALAYGSKTKTFDASVAVAETTTGPPAYVAAGSQRRTAGAASIGLSTESDALASGSSEEESPLDHVGSSKALTHAVSAASVARTRGSGLGLPVARLMARALGGDVDLYTQPLPAPSSQLVGPQLTVFLFILPFSAVHRSGSEDSTSVDITTSQEGASTTKPGQKRKGVTGVTENPLFGRSGTLSTQARQLLRSRACEHVTSHVPTVHTGNHSTHSLSPVHTVECVAGVVGHPSNSQSPYTVREVSVSRARAATLLLPPAGESHKLMTCAQEGQEEGDTSDRMVSECAVSPGISLSLLQDANSPLAITASASDPSPPGQAISETMSSPCELPTSGGGGSSSSSSSSSSPAVTVTAATPGKSARTTSRKKPENYIHVLYAEDDGTNRRLMERMMTRLGTAPSSASATTTGQGMQAVGTTQIPAGVQIRLVTVADGWEALCALYKHGHIDYETLRKAKTNAANSEGELPLPPPPDLGQRALRSTAPPFDIILLDIDMPRASGDQVAQYIRDARTRSTVQLHASPDVPVVAVTGRAIDLQMKSDAGSDKSSSPDTSPAVSSLVTDATMACFDGALGKPFKLAHLATLLDVSCFSNVSSKFGRRSAGSDAGSTGSA